jgi:hypothetical protein
LLSFGALMSMSPLEKRDSSGEVIFFQRERHPPKAPFGHAEASAQGGNKGTLLSFSDLMPTSPVKERDSSGKVIFFQRERHPPKSPFGHSEASRTRGK